MCNFFPLKYLYFILHVTFTVYVAMYVNIYCTEYGLDEGPVTLRYFCETFLVYQQLL